MKNNYIFPFILSVSREKMNISELRSPFVDRVINLIPQGHEDAMKQAFYNVAAICLFIALSAASMSVEPRAVPAALS